MYGIIDALVGGVIGFYCAHLYAHNTEGADVLMPYALKGIDMALFSTFQSLGLSVKACPVMDLEAAGFEDMGGGSEALESIQAGTGFHGLVNSSYDESCDDDLMEVGT